MLNRSLKWCLSSFETVEKSCSGDYRYGFNGKEKEDGINSGAYDFDARIYDARLGRTLSMDPAWKEYPWLSSYSFLNNNPISFIDDDGKRFYFVGGAGNDADGWNYVNRFKAIFTKKGIEGFTRIDASGGKLKDVAFTASYRSFSRMGYEMVKRDGGGYDMKIKRRDHKMIDKAVNDIMADLAKNPLKEGEQLNLGGYSYGSVLQAHVALRLAEKGVKVDNVVLIGSPVSDKSDLYKELTTNKNIGNVIRHDIPGDKLSNPKTEGDFIEGGKQNSSDDGPHFDLARPGAEANKKINELGDKLKTEGVK